MARIRNACAASTTGMNAGMAPGQAHERSGGPRGWPLPCRTKSSSPAGPAPDPVSLYFRGIRRFPLLTAGEELELVRRMSEGDGSARRRMIESNLRLVVNIARRYLNRGLQIQDLVNEGNIGLIKAVERFKASKKCRFSTYATFWIRQSVERAIANQAATVRLPIHINMDIAKVSRVTRELTMSLEREPTAAEVAAGTGFSGRYVKKLGVVGMKTCSLDAALSDDSGLSLMDRLEDAGRPAPADWIGSAQRTRMVGAWLDKLDRNERFVVKMRFGFDGEDPRTLEDLGRLYGVTRERIRQIEVRALKRLKDIMGASGVASLDAV